MSRNIVRRYGQAHTQDESIEQVVNTNAQIVSQAKRKQSNIPDASFDPACEELQRTWSTYASNIICINPYPNGITLSVHKQTQGNAKNDDAEQSKSIVYKPYQFNLRYRDTRDYQLPAGKYFLYKEEYLPALEGLLSSLRKQSALESTVIYLGTTADPFFALSKKFDATMSCIELLTQYRPGFIVVQTRSPMVISALPYLKGLGDKAIVSINFESRLESSIARYTPGQPRLKDRLVAAEGLRAQGIKVQLSASPILPYGEYYRDAWEFAELLDNHADYISMGCLASGETTEEAQLRVLPIARRLVADNNFKVLRPHAYRYLFHALKAVAPEKILIPAPKFGESSVQLSLFAA